MNAEIFDIIKNKGLGLHSPTLDHLSTSITALERVHAKVGALPIAVPPLPTGFPEDTITAVQTAIDNAKQSLIHTQSATQTRVNDVFTDIVYSSQSGRLDGGSGCGSLSLLTGSISGALDSAIDDMTQLANGVVENVQAYLAGTMDESVLTPLLESFKSSAQPFLDELQSIQDKERALLAQMKNTIESASLTKTITGLWQDPCAKALLGPLLPDEIKGLLDE
ncbi:DUF7217 family protein [Vibrio vulnificus]|uniref:DUF7217 family protein n=1 Tax=Vibrio vulnificus TaxID=672 RepID=UPI00102A6959|nr:hypothetical protein [Vibrio vulnificus]RZP88957.1 hypothetical protein D8T54_20230 [Vibrio vulnificus]